MLERIEKVLREYKEADDLTISESTTFTDLELDSLDIMDLVMSMEEEFSVTLTLDNKLTTIGELMTLIQNSK